MLLQRKNFLVKERVGFGKLVDTYDIIDPANGQNVGLAKEEPPGWAKWLRLLIAKQLLPTTVNIYEAEGGARVFSIHRGPMILRGTADVISGDGQSLGRFKSNVLSFGFQVYGHNNQQVAEVKGDWKGWNFKLLAPDGREIGTVTKKWAGLGKELFTSADNYMVALHESAQDNPAAGVLLLAAGLAIDLIFKEKH